jgi:hypothetical protein
MSNSLQNCDTNSVLSSRFLKIDTRDFAVHQIAENNTTRFSAHENDGQMILFCVTECLGSFKVATKNLQPAFQNCRQTLFNAGKCYLLQANVFLCKHINKLQAGFFCRHINKLQAGPVRMLKIGNASSAFNIA